MKKVIIIEDDPMVAMINMEYLSKCGNVEIIGQGSTKEETLTFLKKFPIDLILLDVYLGDENGIDILQSIRALGYTTDVIMITSANGSQDIKKALALGCVDYLIKPFDFDRFKIAIEKTLQRDEILKNEKLYQCRIDIINLNENLDCNCDLPKGLNKNTLEEIELIIDNIQEEQFGIKDVCELSHLSNVTIKKYLDYLESTKKIKAFSIYGNIGRPLYMYKKIKKIR